MSPRKRSKSERVKNGEGLRDALTQQTHDVIADLLQQSDNNGWHAWRLSALRRIEGDYTDKVLARTEHYLLRYAVASAGFDGIAREFRKFDETWYHSIARPIKCFFGMSTRDRSLREWEELGYRRGQEWRANEQRATGYESEDEAKRFMLKTTEEVAELLESNPPVRSQKRMVYWWMRLLRWQQCRQADDS